MAKEQSASALRHLRALFATGTATGLTDGELLERYTTSRAASAEAATAAELAFAALVDRHGAMVWGICHRVLGDTHEAEDAFQATFLVLVRKAGSVRVDGSLGGWLYGVAHRVALRARSEAQRRGSWTGRNPPASADDPVGEAELRELRNAVGEELDRLPARYRCPVELCHIQGMSYDQAARQGGTPLDQPPCDRSTTRLTSDEKVIFRSIVVRLTNLPDGAEHQWWINEANGGSQDQARRDGKSVPDLSETLTQFPMGMPTCTLLFKVAAGPWRTVQTWGKSPGALARADTSYIFGDVIATKKGTSLSVTHNIQDMSVRLVAVDGDRNEHPAKIRSGSGVKDFRQIVVEFDLPPDKVKEFWVQTRPYEAVEVPGIALKP